MVGSGSAGNGVAGRFLGQLPRLSEIFGSRFDENEVAIGSRRKTVPATNTTANARIVPKITVGVALLSSSLWPRTTIFIMYHRKIARSTEPLPAVNCCFIAPWERQ